MFAKLLKFRYLFFLLLLNCLQLNTVAQIPGCTDPLANNYNSNATINNGSCVYNTVTVSPVVTHTLVTQLTETSGLIFWNDTIYTHNDNTDKRIYGLDSSSGSIIKTYSLGGLTNIDWEEITQDSASVFIGDFGNNVNGNRNNLRIYKINKVSLWNNNPIIDTIKFSYSNQTTFTATGSNNTDFDCEAFIATKDSLFLFTKQWVSKKTSVYKLPKAGGTYTAQLKYTHDVQGLITGATYIKDSNMVALCGYNNLLQPFFYLLYDYSGNAFFSGNKRKIEMNAPFNQVEGITSKNGARFYVSNEYFSQAPLPAVPQKLSVYDLGIYLYPSLSTGIKKTGLNESNRFNIFPSVVYDALTIQSNTTPDLNYQIHDLYSNLCVSGYIPENKTQLQLSNLRSGVYFITIQTNSHQETFKFIKK